MKLIGRPMSIQNTDGPDWLVTCDNVVTVTTGESVSFTVLVPRSGAGMGEIQQQAVKAAIALLQKALKASEG